MEKIPFDKKKIPVIKLQAFVRVPGLSAANDIRYALTKRFTNVPEDLSGIRFRLSLKEGKNRKLRSFRFKEFKFVTRCECCGPELMMER